MTAPRLVGLPAAPSLSGLTPPARATLGWQTMLADLALILFMVMAAVEPSKPALPDPRVPLTGVPRVTVAGGDAGPAPSGETLAVWRPGGPSLARWLAGQAGDAREQLTIVAHYHPGGQARAVDAATTLAASAGGMGRAARIVIEADGIAGAASGRGGARGSGGEVDVFATLAFDRVVSPGP